MVVDLVLDVFGWVVNAPRVDGVAVFPPSFGVVVGRFVFVGVVNFGVVEFFLFFIVVEPASLFVVVFVILDVRGFVVKPVVFAEVAPLNVDPGLFVVEFPRGFVVVAL